MFAYAKQVSDATLALQYTPSCPTHRETLAGGNSSPSRSSNDEDVPG